MFIEVWSFASIPFCGKSHGNFKSHHSVKPMLITPVKIPVIEVSKFYVLQFSHHALQFSHFLWLSAHFQAFFCFGVHYVRNWHRPVFQVSCFCICIMWETVFVGHYDQLFTQPETDQGRSRYAYGWAGDSVPGLAARVMCILSDLVSEFMMTTPSYDCWATQAALYSRWESFQSDDHSLGLFAHHSSEVSHASQWGIRQVPTAQKELWP